MSCLQDAEYKRAEQLRADAVRYASNWKLAQAIIMAIDNATQLIANYKKQNDIASEAMDMMEANQRHMKNVFWKHELKFLAEFCSPEDIEEIEVVGRRIAGRLVSQVAGQFARLFDALRCNVNKYCASAYSKALQDLYIARSQAIANARILGRMQAFAEHQQFDDQNFKRKVQAAGLGNDLIGQAATFMGQGAAGYAQIGQRIAGQLSQNFEMLGQAIGMRYGDPGRSWEMNQMLMGNIGQMPYTPNGIVQQEINTASATPDFNFGIDPSRIGGFQKTAPDTTTSWFGQQAQMQMNNGRVGNWDLVRSGTKTYVDYDTYGKPIMITVDMKDFPLEYADDRTEGDE